MIGLVTLVLKILYCLLDGQDGIGHLHQLCFGQMGTGMRPALDHLDLFGTETGNPPQIQHAQCAAQTLKAARNEFQIIRLGIAAALKHVELFLQQRHFFMNRFGQRAQHIRARAK